MGKFLRIANRGPCSRDNLRYVGLSEKDAKMDDPDVGGWFGSGTKYAQIAALNLGIATWITSRDAGGSYFVTYRSEPIKGRDDRCVIMRIYEGHPEKIREIETQFTLKSCRNWKEPIGDDRMKSFRVVREYLRNAYDEDKQPVLAYVDDLEWAPEGWTYVYLTATEEVRKMISRADRYFKYLCGAKPVFQLSGVARAFPKAEAGMTRVYSLGTMAYCSKDKNHSTLYDYSVDVKKCHEGRAMLSEERIFVDVGKVHIELNKLLASWTDVPRIAHLIAEIENGNADFEAYTLGSIADVTPVPAKAAWASAFGLLYDKDGREAVLSTDAYFDELARYSYLKRPVPIVQHHLRRFLKKCGVKEARECVPEIAEGKEYRLVVPDEDRRIRVSQALQIIFEEWPETKGWTFHAFIPLTEKMKQTRGFCQLPEGKDPVVHYQLACVDSMDTLLHVLIHEYRHGRTRALDHQRPFVSQADQDLKNLLMEKHEIEHEPEIDVAAVPLPKIAP